LGNDRNCRTTLVLDWGFWHSRSAACLEALAVGEVREPERLANLLRLAGPSLSLSLSIYIYLSISISICLSIYLSISIYPSIYVYLSILLCDISCLPHGISHCSFTTYDGSEMRCKRITELQNARGSRLVREREFLSDNLLVRIHLIIEMILVHWSSTGGT